MFTEQNKIIVGIVCRVTIFVVYLEFLIAAAILAHFVAIGDMATQRPLVRWSKLLSRFPIRVILTTQHFTDICLLTGLRTQLFRACGECIERLAAIHAYACSVFRLITKPITQRLIPASIRAGFTCVRIIGLKLKRRATNDANACSHTGIIPQWR